MLSIVLLSVIIYNRCVTNDVLAYATSCYLSIRMDGWLETDIASVITVYKIFLTV